MATANMFVFSVLASVLLTSFVIQATTLVSAPAGSFQGIVDKDPQGNTYVAFKGIPYAKPPIGDLRLAKPQPRPKLDSTFDATKTATMCPQPDIYLSLMETEQGKEDCLVLNIYSKDINPVEPKKVMVFIHGGGYVVGSSIQYVPGHFVTSNDVIIVTINYRLGLLGFLSTEDESSPGNFGLWDMTLALQWIKDNIASFGGDPSDVAISGESAGGSAVGYLSISPYTKGLFTKAYPQSGTCTSAFGKAIDPQKDSLKFAAAVGCYKGDVSQRADSVATKKIVECLRDLPMSNFTSYVAFTLDNVVFVPTVDKDFVPRPTTHLLKDNDYLKSIGFFDRSYMVGIVNNEAAIMKLHVDNMIGYMRGRKDISEEEKDAILSKMVSSAYSFYAASRMETPVPSSVVDKIVTWYTSRYGDDALSEMTSDLAFPLPTYDFVDAASKGTDVWMFHFNHFPRFMNGKERGIVHALDLPYWFDFPVHLMGRFLGVGIDKDIGMEEDDIKISHHLSTIISEFTKTGKVEHMGSVDDKKLTWPQYNTEDMQYLDLKTRPEIRQRLELDKRRLWLEDVPDWMASQQQDVKHTEL